jgi:putative ABC transport system permease protein
MTATLEHPVVTRDPGPGDGRLVARRAVVRWAWRMFRREWRQQLLVLSLIVVAVAAVVLGGAIATNTPTPANTGFGTAQDLATFQGSPSQLSSDIAQVQHRFGTVDVIENQSAKVPGSIETYDIRAQNFAGAFGGPLLSLVSGHWPTGSGEVALTSGLSSELDLGIGGVWREDGQSRTVVGIVQNSQNLLDEFALVAPGQLTSPSQVTVLFDAGGFDVTRLGGNFESVSSVSSASSGNALNPDTIVLTLATLGMLLIALVAIGGFTVIAQRRLRSIGMLGSLGATDKNIRLVVLANGVVVGIVGTLLGAMIGLLGWLLYRPHLESSSHHVIGVLALPWVVIGPAMGIALVATVFASSRPARAITKVPIVSALAGRPAQPKQIHRSAVPGIVVVVIGFFLLGYAGSQRGGGGAPQLVFGLVGLVVGIILLAPMLLTLLAKFVDRTPLTVRMATRDLARYRARSGSALAAITLGILIAVIICVVAAARYGNVLDYAGPNLASNQLVVYAPKAANAPASPNGSGGSGGSGGSKGGRGTIANPVTSSSAGLDAVAEAVKADQVVELETTSASLQHAASGRQFTGNVYVATPQLLKAFGINPASINPNADILTMRPGFASISNMQIVYGNYFGPNGPGGTVKVSPGSGDGPGSGNGPGGGGGTSQDQNPYPCPKSECLANPVIQQVNALPSGVSAPNTVITEHAIETLGLSTSVSVSGWLLQAPNAISASQLSTARLAASAAGMSIESKNDEPSSSEVINWATVFGILVALAVLAMSVGLIRSEAASDLRTLAATGASSRMRRALTSATAGSLALLGALLGTVIGYIGVIGFLRSNSLDGLSSLGSVPIQNLLLILIGMPLIATGIGWLIAGREPSAMAHQPIE